MGKYFKYAIGEILLIMVGIFMALQLQNWNENRIKNDQFNATLEQLYNSLKTDSEHYLRQSVNSELYVTRSLNILSNDTSKYQKAYLPFYFHGIALMNTPFQSESEYYVDDLESNAHSQEQKLLTKEVLKYISLIKTKSNFDPGIVNDLIQKYKIPRPKATSQGWVLDSTYHSEQDIERIKDALITEDFQYVLKTMQSQAFSHQLFTAGKHNDAESIRNLIKTYYPEVRVIYRDIGIIGTSINGFDDVGAKSTPMLLTNEEESIWEIDLYLKKGEVKFRTRDSWAQNWGAIPGNAALMEAQGIQDGANIIISEEGDYHVTLNLSTNVYQFVKQND